MVVSFQFKGVTSIAVQAAVQAGSMTSRFARFASFREGEAEKGENINKALPKRLPLLQRLVELNNKRGQAYFLSDFMESHRVT